MNRPPLSPRRSLAALLFVGASVLVASSDGAGAERFDPPRVVGSHTVGFQVPEIFRATPRKGWPHALDSRELRGLAREVYRGHRKLYGGRRARSATCRVLYGAPHCVVVDRRGLAVRGARVRLWEDGSGRARYFVPDFD